jgi:hypothetical protein
VAVGSFNGASSAIHSVHSRAKAAKKARPVASCGACSGQRMASAIIARIGGETRRMRARLPAFGTISGASNTKTEGMRCRLLQGRVPAATQPARLRGRTCRLHPSASAIGAFEGVLQLVHVMMVPRAVHAVFVLQYRAGGRANRRVDQGYQANIAIGVDRCPGHGGLPVAGGSRRPFRAQDRPIAARQSKPHHGIDAALAGGAPAIVSGRPQDGQPGLRASRRQASLWRARLPKVPA